MDKQEPGYSRGEVEIALWMAFTHGDRGALIDRTFKGRIQKLLDLDRASARSVPPLPFAFHSGPPGGRGQEARFTLLDALSLAVGLDLLDLGFKQSEVVFLLCHLRADLEDQLETIRSNPPVLRAPLKQTDNRLFMALRKVEMTEILGTRHSGSNPMILRPQFVPGAHSQDLLAVLGYNDRARIVLEIAEITVLLEQELAKAPSVKRGRRS